MREELQFQVIKDLLHWMRTHPTEDFSLEGLAKKSGYTPTHFQRIFQNHVGLSPKQFELQLKMQEAREILRGKISLLEASEQLGLSSPSRLHELCLKIEKLSPQEFRLQNAKLGWGVASTWLGEALFVWSERGLCSLDFLSMKKEASSVLANRYPNFELKEKPQRAQDYADQITKRFFNHEKRPMALVLRGTEFQHQVWEALLRIPEGRLTTYGEISRQIGRPQAHRAVGTAVGQNPLAILIPCHRAIRQEGFLGGYHWGLERKKILLAQELNEKA